MFRPCLALLCDLSLEIDDPSWEEIPSRAEFIAGLLPLDVSRRLALVIGLHQHGVGRMQAEHLELQGMEPEVFRDMGEVRCLLAAGSASTVSRRSEEADFFHIRDGPKGIRSPGLLHELELP